jgi:hypothetical protein
MSYRFVDCLLAGMRVSLRPTSKQSTNLQKEREREKERKEGKLSIVVVR